MAASPIISAAALSRLLAELDRRAVPHALHSQLHGPRHWRDVARVGLALDVPGADPELLFLFALLHDTCRHNDDEDPQHGPRAAALTGQLLADGVLSLEPERAERLRFAIASHTDLRRHEDPTIGGCLDADRLTLWRVGKTPDPYYLSTAQARHREAAAFSFGVLSGPDATWEDIRRALTDETTVTTRRNSSAVSPRL